MMPDSPLRRCCQENCSFFLSQSRNLKNATVLYQCKFPEFLVSILGFWYRSSSSILSCLSVSAVGFPCISWGDYELWSCSSADVSARGSLCLELEVLFFSWVWVWNRLQFLSGKAPEHAFCERMIFLRSVSLEGRGGFLMLFGEPLWQHLLGLLFGCFCFLLEDAQLGLLENVQFEHAIHIQENLFSSITDWQQDVCYWFLHICRTDEYCLHQVFIWVLLRPLFGQQFLS